MTPSEREELARWLSRYHQQHCVEKRSVTWEDGNAYLNWLDENAERIAAALRAGTTMDARPCCTQWDTCKQPCAPRADHWRELALREPVGVPRAVEHAANVVLLRYGHLDLERFGRMREALSHAGTAGSASVNTEATPAGGQSQPATEVCPTCNYMRSDTSPCKCGLTTRGKRLPCGCEDSPRTMCTMVRAGRCGWGHYAQDGDFMGECVSPPSAATASAEPAPTSSRMELLLLNRRIVNLRQECDALRAENERLTAEVERMRPVVEAVNEHAYRRGRLVGVLDALDAYRRAKEKA